MRSFALVFVVAFTLALPVSPVRAEHGKSPVGERAQSLIAGLGDHTHTVTTSKSEAQAYFNQGVRLIFAFNHDEAIKAFRAVAEIDPSCAMAHWGIALALGPNYNLEAEEERSKAAYEAVRRAQQLAANSPPREQAYIAALAKRYSAKHVEDRKSLDIDYANAMRQVKHDFPDDLDAAVLFAEAMMDLRPWDLWTADGKPQPGTEEIVAVLEDVLRRNPNHPGANHFYIHAVEASPTPALALPSALRLSGMAPGSGLAFSEPLMPAAGHMVHMPAHIYFRLGWYSAAAEANRRAIEADRKYIAQHKPSGAYPMMYYPHNIHFLWSALTMEGRGAEAIEAATQVSSALTEEMVLEMPMIEGFVPTRLYALARFEKWDEIALEKPPGEKLSFATGMWHYVQGLAAEATNNISQADEHQKRLQAIIASTPEDKLLMRHSAARLLRIAACHLAAELDGRRADWDAAIKQLETSIELQDGLAYDEPPPWYIPMRQLLGQAQLSAGQPAKAEAAFRKDLEQHPENGWALDGLQRSLRAQNKSLEADQVQALLKRAWGQADFKPAASAAGK